MIRANLLLVAVLFANLSHAQRFKTENSVITFFSKASLEDIKGENTKAQSIFDAEKGDIAFSIPIKEFEFDKSLMKEHFNEKYLESEKYPKGTFQGRIEGFQLDRAGVQQVTANGKLTIHGVTKEVRMPGTLEFVDGKVLAKATFKVRLEDYKIKIPQLMWQNIAEEVDVTVDFTYKAL